MARSTYLSMSPRPELSATNVRLAPYGSTTLLVPHRKFEHISHIGANTASIVYYVIDDSNQRYENLLSFEASVMLGLINPISEVALRSLQNAPELFRGLGSLPGEVTIQLRERFEPVIAPQRRFAFTLLPKIETALREMLKLRVIARVEEPTDWVSNILVVEKEANSLSIRICLDPSFLNQAIIIPKYQIPKTEELLARLAGKRVFSVIHMSKGFWQMVLDERSLYLTTFQTPFGRYRFLRMCFGICSAPEIFMLKIVQMFGDIEGVVPYFDDLIICAATEVEHDRIMHKVLVRAKGYNVRFNPQKLQFKQKKVKFLGVIVTENEIQIDPERCAAMVDMPRPINKKELLRFLGMVKYVSSFIPNLSAETEALRGLTKLHVEFEWTRKHQTEYDAIKQMLSSPPVLKIFDGSKPIVVQTNASKSGIGACLLQELSLIHISEPTRPY